MRFILQGIVLFFILIHGLVSTAQIQSSKTLLHYYNIGNNGSIISSGMLLSYLQDTTNRIYDFDFTNGQENVSDKTVRLKILYGVPANEVLIPWRAGKDYSDQKYLYRYFFLDGTVYQKTAADLSFTLNPADSTTANNFLYEKLTLRNRFTEPDVPLHVSILYTCAPGSGKPNPYLIHFTKAADTRTRLGGGDFNFNIKWEDFISHLSKHYSGKIIYYEPICKALNERYPYFYHTYSDVCDLPAELVYRKNKIDSVRFYKEVAGPDAFYVRNYELYKTFSYDSLHDYLTATYKIKDFLLPLPEVWKQHQQLFVPDSTKTLAFNNIAAYDAAVQKKIKRKAAATVSISETVNIVCKNNARLSAGAQSFKSLLLEYIQNNALTLYAAEGNYYESEKTLQPTQIDTREIFNLYEYAPVYDACCYKDSVYFVNELVRIKALRDTCFEMDPVEVVQQTDAYLTSGITADAATDVHAFDVKQYFEKDSTYHFDWAKYITQITLFSTLEAEAVSSCKKSAPEYISIDLCDRNNRGITVRLGLVKWADLKALMLEDKRAWYAENNKNRNYIQDIESAAVLKLFDYLTNEVE